MAIKLESTNGHVNYYINVPWVRTYISGIHTVHPYTVDLF